MQDTNIDAQAPVSKTRRKREMDALQALGEELLHFTDTELAGLGLPDKLHEALLTARRIRAHGARRRQLQYIGKLMRNTDTASLRTALEEKHHQHATHSQQFHLIEELRDALISEGDTFLATVLEHFPTADRQHLRKLARQASKERDQGHPPTSSRRLFRYLRELQQDT